MRSVDKEEKAAFNFLSHDVPPQVSHRAQINACRRMRVLLSGRHPESVGACTLQICSLNVNSHGHSQASKLADLGTVLDAEAGRLDSLTCRTHRWCGKYILSARTFVVALTSERGHYGAEAKGMEGKTHAACPNLVCIPMMIYPIPAFPRLPACRLKCCHLGANC